MINSIKKLINSERGISPVVSVTMMLVVTVSVVVIGSTVVFDLTEEIENQDESSYIDLNVQEDPDTGDLIIDVERTTNESGEIIFRTEDGNETTISADIGRERVELNRDAGDSINIIAENGDTSSSTRLNTIEAEYTFSTSNTDSGSSTDSGSTSDPNTNEPNDITQVFNNMEQTADGEYIITNDHELQAMKEDPSADYVLGNNIDASGTDQWNGGSGFKPIGNLGNEFTGSLDGKSYEIQGLYINRPTENPVSLIGKHYDGLIQNIKIININVTGGSAVGGLVGIHDGNIRGNNPIIEDVEISGDIEGKAEVGGLVGYNNAGDIRKSAVTADVSSVSEEAGGNVGGLVGKNSGNIRKSAVTGNVTSNNGHSGGLIGNQGAGTVENSYSTSNVSANGPSTGAGGIAGVQQGGTITDVYSSGNVTGDFNNGLVGLGFDGTVKYSYWDKSTASGGIGLDDDPTSIEGLTTTEMQGSSAESNMPAFDFTNVWTTVVDDYPQLQQ